jgi:hypothetical protein
LTNIGTATASSRITRKLAENARILLSGVVSAPLPRVFRVIRDKAVVSFFACSFPFVFALPCPFVATRSVEHRKATQGRTEMGNSGMRGISMIAVAMLLASAQFAGAQVSPAAPAAKRDTVIREYRGAYQRGFEQSWFVPCNAPSPDDKLWWVTLTDQALLQRDSLLAKISKEKTDGLIVRWRATVGPRMPAGMMGRGTRYMLVTEIIEIKPLPETGACPPERAS